METKHAVTALSALAHGSRLAIFRLLVARGPQGIAAGEIGEQLAIPPATLSFHLKELHRAGLVTQRQNGRFVIYAAHFDGIGALVAFLTENCCAGNPCLATKPRSGRAPVKHTRRTASAKG